MNLSLAGCGFLGLYHLGVVSCLKEHAPQFVNSLRSVSGASAGALSGLVLLVDCPLGLITNEMMKVVKSIRSSSLGPYNPKFNITKTLSALLASFAPDNVHEIVSGRLFISLTRLSDMQNVMISEFHSKNDLIEALCTSSFVPIWSGMTPIIYRGEHYIDGGFSDNQPQPFGQNTILVSPFYGESDICPNDNSMSFHQFCCNNTNIQVSLSNIYRLSRALFPPEPRVLRSMCQQGYLDTLRFLQNKMAGYSLHNSITSVAEVDHEQDIDENWEMNEINIPNLEKEDKGSGNSQDLNEDEFSTCSDVSSNYEEAVAQSNVIFQLYETGGIHLPFGMKEALHMACTEPSSTPTLHYLSSIILTPYSIAYDALVSLAFRLLNDIPIAQAKLSDTCRSIYYELGGYVSSINSKLFFKLQIGAIMNNCSDSTGLLTMTKNLPRRVSRRLSRNLSVLYQKTVMDNFSSLVERVRLITTTMAYMESWQLSHLVSLLSTLLKFIFQHSESQIFARI